MRIDLNCDMGEGCGNDAELMDFVSSVNIACGYHAGDAETMRRTVDLALEKGVAIGAHPSYPDRANFGRSDMDLPTDEIHKLVQDQIFALSLVCDKAGGKLSHVKPHGALYNQSAKDAGIARTIAKAVREVNGSLILFGLSGSNSIVEAAVIGLQAASEVFADRTYQATGTLTPRSEPNAVITDENTAVTQVMDMIRYGGVRSTDAVMIPIVAETVCIHGDGEKALEFARTIHNKLIENGVTIGAING